MDAVFANLLHISVCFFVGFRYLCRLELSGAHLDDRSTESYTIFSQFQELLNKKRYYIFTIIANVKKKIFSVITNNGFVGCRII